MSELPFDAQELFRETRAALAPTAADLERVRKRVQGAIAGGAAVGALALAKTTASTAGSSVGVVAAIAATLATGGVAAWSLAHRATAPIAPQAPAPAIVVRVEPPPPVVAQQTVPVPASVPAVTPPRPRASHVVAMPAPVEPAPAPPQIARSGFAGPRSVAEGRRAGSIDDSLEAELATVRSAGEALHREDAEGALAIIGSAHVTQLAAELAAIEIDALCALDRRDDARAHATTFFSRWPHSALRDRVTRSCGGDR